MNKFPIWLKKELPSKKIPQEMSSLFKELNVNTVCQSARCPNIGKCFSNKTATFMILGQVCSRNCTFCAVKKGTPEPINNDEPKNIADICSKLEIKHAVITSVTRDDLPNGGAAHFCKVIEEIRKLNKNIIIEILTPDFMENFESLELIAESGPDIFNHNIETVPALYPQIRPKANFKRSLRVLKKIKELNPDIYTKSGIMVGLGEYQNEIFDVMEKIREADVSILTIGQYLQPTKEHYPVKEYVIPEKFAEYKNKALEIGFSHVLSAPLVRSSFEAIEFSKKIGLIKDKKS